MQIINHTYKKGEIEGVQQSFTLSIHRVSDFSNTMADGPIRIFNYRIVTSALQCGNYKLNEATDASANSSSQKKIMRSLNEKEVPRIYHPSAGCKTSSQPPELQPAVDAQS